MQRQLPLSSASDETTASSVERGIPFEIQGVIEEGWAFESDAISQHLRLPRWLERSRHPQDITFTTAFQSRARGGSAASGASPRSQISSLSPSRAGPEPRRPIFDTRWHTSSPFSIEDIVRLRDQSSGSTQPQLVNSVSLPRGGPTPKWSDGIERWCAGCEPAHVPPSKSQRPKRKPLMTSHGGSTDLRLLALSPQTGLPASQGRYSGAPRGTKPRVRFLVTNALECIDE